MISRLRDMPLTVSRLSMSIQPDSLSNCPCRPVRPSLLNPSVATTSPGTVYVIRGPSLAPSLRLTSLFLAVS
jgi:hypothetical protein